MNSIFNALYFKMSRDYPSKAIIKGLCLTYPSRTLPSPGRQNDSFLYEKQSKISVYRPACPIRLRVLAAFGKGVMEIGDMRPRDHRGRGFYRSRPLPELRPLHRHVLDGGVRPVRGQRPPLQEPPLLHLPPVQRVLPQPCDQHPVDGPGVNGGGELSPLGRFISCGNYTL
jgi:hypothetical protein